MQVILNRQGQAWLKELLRPKCPVCMEEIEGDVFKPPNLLRPYQYTKCAGCGRPRNIEDHTLAYKRRWAKAYKQSFYRKENV